MAGISFSTAVSYGDQYVPCTEKLLECFDDYFFISGEKAVVDYTKRSSSQEVQFKQVKSSCFLVAIKIISYITIVVPFCMLIGKLILRSLRRFFLFTVIKLPHDISKDELIQKINDLKNLVIRSGKLDFSLVPLSSLKEALKEMGYRFEFLTTECDPETVVVGDLDSIMLGDIHHNPPVHEFNTLLAQIFYRTKSTLFLEYKENHMSCDKNGLRMVAKNRLPEEIQIRGWDCICSCDKNGSNEFFKQYKKFLFKRPDKENLLNISSEISIIFERERENISEFLKSNCTEAIGLKEYVHQKALNPPIHCTPEEITLKKLETLFVFFTSYDFVDRQKSLTSHIINSENGIFCAGSAHFVTEICKTNDKKHQHSHACLEVEQQVDLALRQNKIKALIVFPYYLKKKKKSRNLSSEPPIDLDHEE